MACVHAYWFSGSGWPRDQPTIARRVATGIEARHSIRVHKRIPAGAGLVVDRAIPLQRSDSSIECMVMHSVLRACSMAASLGRDVPFFMSDAPLALGGDATRAAHARGPGAAPAVVVMPAASVSTAQAYASLGDRIRVAGPARIEVAALGSWDALADVACNDFERVVLPEIPALTPVLALLRSHGARIAQLTGSGSAVFGTFDLPEAADAAAEELRAAEADLQVFRTQAAV